MLASLHFARRVVAAAAAPSGWRSQVRTFIPGSMEAQRAAEYVGLPERVTQLSAVQRVNSGTTIAKHYRKKGYVPGLLYGCDQHGKEEQVKLGVSQQELHYRRFMLGDKLMSTVITLDVDGRKTPVIIKHLHTDPVSNEPMAVGFMRWFPLATPKIRMPDGSRRPKGIRVAIPIEWFNVDRCTGVNLGGYLNRARYYVDCMVLVDQLPQKLTVDLTDRGMGWRMYVRDIAFPPGITPLRPDELLCNIRGMKDDDDLFGAEQTPAA